MWSRRICRWRSRTAVSSSTYSTFCVAISNTRRTCSSPATRSQDAEQVLAQGRQRRAAAAGRRCGGRLLHRQAHALHHRVEEVALVLEVPVDGAAGDAGGLRDVLQRRARHPLRLEQALGGVEDALRVARASSLVLRAMRVSCVEWDRNIHSRLYVYCAASWICRASADGPRAAARSACHRLTEVDPP